MKKFEINAIKTLYRNLFISACNIKVYSEKVLININENINGIESILLII